MTNSISRRNLLARVVQISIGGALVSAAVEASAADSACIDPSTLSSDELNTRNSLHWTAKSTQANKACDGCAFFMATSGGCGTCMIFMGPTYAAGYCDSWTAKQS